MTEGWKCPVCSRGVAPGEKCCDHGGAASYSPQTQPPGEIWKPVHPYTPSTADPLPHSPIVTSIQWPPVTTYASDLHDPSDWRKWMCWNGHGGHGW